MPRPKSELTKSGRAVGVRLTESEYQEWVRLGASKWLRGVLRNHRIDMMTKSFNPSQGESKCLT